MLQPEPLGLVYSKTPRKHYRRRMRKLKDPFTHSKLKYWREEVDYAEDDIEQEEDWEDFGVHSRHTTTAYNKPTLYSYLYLNSSLVETIRMANELNLVWNALGHQPAKKIYVRSTDQTIIKKLLSEAWLEMAERLKPGRQLVKLRRSLIQDVDEHNSDLANAELIFPEEVWEIILHLLTDWTDMYNCSYVCTLFQKILRPFTVLFRFPEVFACLYKHLNGAKSLDCRKVCKAWCDGVDRLFENHASLRPHDDESSDARHPPLLTPMEEKRLYFNFNANFLEDDDNRLRNFVRRRQRYPNPAAMCTIGLLNLRLTSLPGQNPIIGRALVINFDWKQIEVKRVLRLYGEHIWYLTVQLNHWTESGEAIKKGEQPNHNFLLEHTPNLRKLRIISSWNGHGPFFNDRLPTLDNLETLQFENGYGNGFSTLAHAYHLTLKRIYVEEHNWLLLHNLGWPSLTELHLNNVDWSFRAGTGTVLNTEFFNSLLQANMPNLRKLACGKQSRMWGKNDCQDCSPYSYTVNYNLDVYGLTLMLGVIAKMSVNTQLNTFRFRFSEYISMDVDVVDPPRPTMDEIFVYAPLSLKTLEVEHFFTPYWGMTCYSFLLHFPFLQNLNVFLRPRFWKDEDEENFRGDDELMPKNKYSELFRNLCDYKHYKIDAILDSELVQVNRYLYTGEMYKSNIWEELPFLKVFTFQLDVYTRDGYEKFWKYKKSGSKQGE